MVGRQEDRAHTMRPTHPLNLVEIDTAMVQSDRQDLCAALLQHPYGRLIGQRLDDHGIARLQQHPDRKVHAHLTAAGDTDVTRIGHHSTLRSQHGRDGFTQQQRATRIAIEQPVFACRPLYRRAIGASQHFRRKQAAVRRALVQLQIPTLLGYGCGLVKPVFRRTPARGRIGTFFPAPHPNVGQRCGDDGAAGARGNQPALGDEVLVSQHDGLAVDVEGGGQFAATGKKGPRQQPPALNLVDQRMNDLHVQRRSAVRIDSFRKQHFPGAQHRCSAFDHSNDNDNHLHLLAWTPRAPGRRHYALDQAENEGRGRPIGGERRCDQTGCWRGLRRASHRRMPYTPITSRVTPNTNSNNLPASPPNSPVCRG